MPDLTTLDDLPDPVRAALAGYSTDPARADLILRVACASADDPLPLYRVLYKFYNRQRRFDTARDYAATALAEAARRACLPADRVTWTADMIERADPAIASHVLLAMKALALLSLRDDRPEDAAPILAILGTLDPLDGSGASVVQALADGA